MSWPDLPAFLTSETLSDWVRAALLLVVGVFLLQLLARRGARLGKARWGPQGGMLVDRGVRLVGGALLAATLLRQLGFELGVLVGAAGVLTVAVGFASQTAASNLISGLFLVGERPFVVGDAIEVEGVTGEVVSVDLVSVKLRTFDNLMVRVPNETLLKARLTNLTHFPIRRADLLIGVSYDSDVRRVAELLLDLADRHPLCLDEPEPVVIHKGFGPSSIDLQFSVWATRVNFLAMRTEVLLQVKELFDREGIEIPFPQHTVHLARGDGS